MADPAAVAASAAAAASASAEVAAAAAVRGEALACLRAFAAQAFGPLPGGDPAPDRLPGPLPVPLTALLRLAEAEGVTEAVAAGLLARLGAAPEARARALLLAPPRRLARARADAHAAELAELGALIPGALALKGAAMLAEVGPPPAWRDMIDLDLLVTPEALGPAVEALRVRGWTGDFAAFSAASDYHFPALIPPGAAPASVELHLRLHWRKGGALGPGALRARARPAAIAGLRVPATADRIAHLILHAQIADRRHARTLARLRDALDWRMLAGRADAPDSAATLETLAQDGGGRARRGGEAFFALQSGIWHAPEAAAPAWRTRHGAWVEIALSRMGNAEAWRAARDADRLGGALAALRSPALLRHMLSGMANPARRARFLARLRPGGAPRGD
jgi:hypothetical protein